MITRLSKQGGRRYGAMGMAAFITFLRSRGASVAPTTGVLVTTFRMLTGAGR